MEYSKSIVCLAAAALLNGCSPSTPPAEGLGQSEAAVFSNGGFTVGDAGAAPPAPWVVTEYLNPNMTGVTIQSPQTLAGLNLVANGGACGGDAGTCDGSEFGVCTGGVCQPTAKTLVLQGTNQWDPPLGAAVSLRYCRYGNRCAIINQHGNLSNVNQLTQTMTVGAGDIDPTDGQVHVRLVVAPVLEDPGHTPAQQPYFFVQLSNLTQGTVLYANYNFANQPGVPWQTYVNGSTYRYTNWQLIDVAPGSPAINMGDSVEVVLIAAGCALGGHMGELYVDALGSQIPGLFIRGTGPVQANAGTSITYNLTYDNESAPVVCSATATCANAGACVAGVCAATGVVVEFTTPPNTTFQSFVPPAGATCTAPVVGTAGTIICTFSSPMPVGFSGSFPVTVAIASGTTGTIACGNYQIGSSQETLLLGNVITTQIGCTLDSQCTAGNWCDESVAVCVPTLANGAPMPIDTGHTAPQPIVNGMCNAPAGAVVCTSGVCDTADNECGYKNGDGTCTVATGPVVCRSGVCDPGDGKCGLANGDGTCTVATGPVVCRSLTCSVSGLCEAPGTCDVDADCTGGKWCFESTHTCTLKEANGTPIPNDPPHMAPQTVLNGTCTVAAATLICVSGLCDTSNSECGYANGHGPCTAGPGPTTGTTVCQSATCSAHGTVCVPATNGCAVDADCSAASYCNTVTYTCVAKLPNGQPVPTVGNHTPVLNGTCGAGVGASVCVSGVCDADGLCGYANGDGSCAAGTPAPVCRSNVCDPDLKCGYANGDGPCIPGAGGNGAVVCRSTLVCALSHICEPAGGCDADADCTGGNWCNISAHTCTAKAPNGSPVGKDPGHTTPVLDGTCGVGVGALTCISGVCDTDGNCGYAVGDGPCNGTGNPTECRSATCSTNGKCEPMNGCNVDPDCTAAQWCNEGAHLCMAKLANGTAIPTDPTTGTMPGSHLDGVCTAGAGAIVCVTGICDPKDNACGLANGDSSCTGNPAACRSGVCTTTGICGCAVDTDCTAGNWCNETLHVCTPQLANGVPVPTDGAHTPIVLNGQCTTANAGAVGPLVCQSGVCDTHDSDCGYADGDGPCTPGAAGNGGTVCRSGVCGTSMVCIASNGCAADSDCATGTWCDINAGNQSLNACVPQLANGMPVPNDPGHSPTLDGSCTVAAGTATCVSGVCDPRDNDCGYANGDGPCTGSTAGSVCRSTICATTGPNMGKCEACVTDSQCPSTAPHCSTTNACIQCTSSAQCSGSTPICDGTSSTCVACNGDQGSSATDACSSAGSPFCFLAGSMAGQCGKCTTSTDCDGHTGNVCNSTTGLCVTGCLSDTDCPSGDWCNGMAPATGTCVPKLANGTVLPSTPAAVATCTAAVGTRVCVSGVCDAKDSTCGYANGDGPCSNVSQCRSDTCIAASMTCEPTGFCSGATDCSAAEFCDSSGACAPKLPSGAACAGAGQCQSAACDQGVCDGITASGNGVLCTASSAPRSGGGDGVAMFGLALAVAGLSRRRRR